MAIQQLEVRDYRSFHEIIGGRGNSTFWSAPTGPESRICCGSSS